MKKSFLQFSLCLMILLIATGCNMQAPPAAEATADTAQEGSNDATNSEEAVVEEMDEGMMRETGAVISVQEVGDITVHSYLAPQQVFANNTYILELANSLVVIDTQFLLPNAMDFRGYADSLGKPIDRVFITHEHPDHFLGSQAFNDLDVYALAEVSAAIAAVGQAEIDEKQADFGEAIASTFVTPMVVEPGTVEIDGVAFELQRIENAEAAVQLVVKLPDHGIVAVGDIVYSGVHLILAGSPPTWTEALESLSAESDTYPIVLPGHGEITDPSVFATNIAWLAKASELMGTATTGEEFKAGLIEAFPELGMDAAMDFVTPFLFPADGGAMESDESSSGEGGESGAAAGMGEVVDMGSGFHMVQVVEDIYAVGNTMTYGMFMVTDEGVIVIDSIEPNAAAIMMDGIRSVTDQPITHLIYSHSHWDHISGGQIFKDAGATVLAHEDNTNYLVNHPAPSPAVVLPDESWSGERHDIVLGGKTVELHHMGPSHGEGMTVFRFPETNAAFIVDLVVPKRVGFAYMPDFTPRGWLESLDKIEALEFETIVFGHNAASGPRSTVTEQKQFILDLQEHIMTRLQAGEDAMAIVDSIDLPQYEEWMGYDMWISMNGWRIMMEMMMGL